jgi:hypothetical protein
VCTGIPVTNAQIVRDGVGRPCVEDDGTAVMVLTAAAAAAGAYYTRSTFQLNLSRF